MAARILFLLLLLPIFVVQSALAHDYGDALGKTLLFLEAQRSGRLPPNQKRVNWRGDSALKDGLAQGVDLVGGYYDAGDNIKFGLPMAFTVTMLSWSIIEYANQLSAAGQLGFAMDAVRWGTDYLVKAHSASDVLWGEVGDGDSDHACWERPEDMTTSRTAFRVDSSSPGSDLAAETAAAMAAASIVFASHGTASYSGLLLAHARQLFAFADKYRGKYDDSIGVAHKYYQSTSGYHDELLWGALWLYQATGEDSFLRYAADNANSLGGVTWRAKEFSWDVKYAGVQVLAAKILLSNGGGSCASTLKQYKAMADYFMCASLRKNQGDNAMATPAGLLYVRPWNNMQYVAASAFLAAVYADYLGPKGLPVDCPAGNVSPADLGRWAQSQVDYILGNNPRGMSYLVGYGPVFPHMVHHRGSSMPSQKSKPVPVGCLQGYADWYNRNLPNPNVLTGALVGGPDKNDNFKDQRNNYEQTEATTYNVAPLLGLLAKFYGLANPKPDAVPLTQKEPPRPAAAPSPQEIALAQAITGWWKSNGHIHYRHRVTVTNNSNRVLRQINVWISNLQGSVWGLLPGTSDGLYVLPPWIKSVKPGQRVHFGYVQAGPQASISVGEYY